MSHGRVELEIFAAIGDIKFPANPGNGVALAHEKSVSEFLAWIRGSHAVHKAQNSFSTAIRYLEQNGVVSFIHIFRFQEIEVGGKFDFPLCVSGCFIEIDNEAIVKVIRIHREIDAAEDFLVGSGQSEGASILNVSAGNNLDARYMRVSAYREEHEK